MTNDAKKPTGLDYEVGYGRPPANRRFPPGRSGNPGGRPRRMTAIRSNTLVLTEAYRTVTVKEGDQVVRIPAIQAVLRSLIASAAKGSGPAARALLDLVRTIEQTIADTNENQQANLMTPENRTDLARRMAFVLSSAAPEKKQP